MYFLFDKIRYKVLYLKKLLKVITYLKPKNESFLLCDFSLKYTRIFSLVLNHDKIYMF